jgi:hypothetical protein
VTKAAGTVLPLERNAADAPAAVVVADAAVYDSNNTSNRTTCHIMPIAQLRDCFLVGIGNLSLCRQLARIMRMMIDVSQCN